MISNFIFAIKSDSCSTPTCKTAKLLEITEMRRQVIGRVLGSRNASLIFIEIPPADITIHVNRFPRYCTLYSSPILNGWNFKQSNWLFHTSTIFARVHTKCDEKTISSFAFLSESISSSFSYSVNFIGTITTRVNFSSVFFSQWTISFYTFLVKRIVFGSCKNNKLTIKWQNMPLVWTVRNLTWSIYC